MTLRRVRVVMQDEIPFYLDVPDGSHVLLTVEEYRERIREAYREGCLSTRTLAVGWPISTTKKRLDEEVEP